MNRGYVDPWAREKMSRSEAQRRYHNLIEYQLRPMLMRKVADDVRVQVLKRIVHDAHRYRYESGVVAGAGTREEIIDLLQHFLKPESGAGEELRDWIKRTYRAFGATLDSEE